MEEWNENNIETFIRDHKEQFDRYDPSTFHDNKFLNKLYNRFKKIVSIVPYLWKVIIVWTIITVFSVYAWNSWIRKDRHEITLKQKIENILTFKK